MSDATRAYNDGVATVALGIASGALATAFGAAIDSEDMDGPLASAISRAQTEVKLARRIHINWAAPENREETR